MSTFNLSALLLLAFLRAVFDCFFGLRRTFLESGDEEEGEVSPPDEEPEDEGVLGGDEGLAGVALAGVFAGVFVGVFADNEER